MPSTKQIEALRERAVLLASREPAGQAMEQLNGIATALDLALGDPPPEEFAFQLFQTGNLAQHLENLEMQGAPPSHPSRYGSLEELRNGLLLG